MKFIGTDVVTYEKGYFGVRRCGNCKDVRDVKLIEMCGKERLLFIPIKNIGKKRFLICEKCGAALEINDDLWNFYKSYPRFDKDTTDEVLTTLKQIENNLNVSNVKLSCTDKLSENSLNMIYDSLNKRFNNPGNVEELISVYFSKE